MKLPLLNEVFMEANPIPLKKGASGRLTKEPVASTLDPKVQDVAAQLKTMKKKLAIQLPTHGGAPPQWLVVLKNPDQTFSLYSAEPKIQPQRRVSGVSQKMTDVEVLQWLDKIGEQDWDIAFAEDRGDDGS